MQQAAKSQMVKRTFRVQTGSLQSTLNLSFIHPKKDFSGERAQMKSYGKSGCFFKYIFYDLLVLFSRPAFDPKSVKNKNIVEPEGASLFSMDQEVVLMVGIQV